VKNHRYPKQLKKGEAAYFIGRLQLNGFEQFWFHIYFIDDPFHMDFILKMQRNWAIAFLFLWVTIHQNFDWFFNWK